jgi:hypothetical protein
MSVYFFVLAAVAVIVLIVEVATGRTIPPLFYRDTQPMEFWFMAFCALATAITAVWLAVTLGHPIR